MEGSDGFESAFQAATKKRVAALMVDGGAFFGLHYKRIVELAAKSRLPTMYVNTRYVEAGGLMTYAEDRPYQFRRAAEYVDKILKGTKPADLPVEQPKKFERSSISKQQSKSALRFRRMCSRGWTRSSDDSSEY